MLEHGFFNLRDNSTYRGVAVTVSSSARWSSTASSPLGATENPDDYFELRWWKPANEGSTLRTCDRATSRWRAAPSAIRKRRASSFANDAFDFPVRTDRRHREFPRAHLHNLVGFVVRQQMPRQV